MIKQVLYISIGNYIDYLCDGVFHGLYCLLGDALTHSGSMWYMYKEHATPEKLLREHGKGFTLYGLLEKDYKNNDIAHKIKTKYFDLIIYGSIHRCIDFLPLVLENYQNNQIIFLDGEDYQNISNHNIPGALYFKRELINPTSNIHPISFSIPSEVITTTFPIKDKFLAPIIPGDLKTYIYNNQTLYYEDYKTAYFGKTTKKFGWDCLRHYEIMMNHCLPWFPDLAVCPRHTMQNFPKSLILRANELYITEKSECQEYYDVLNNVFEYTKNHLTTVESAKYVLSKAVNPIKSADIKPRTLNKPKNIHVITNLTTTKNTNWLINHLENMRIIWHPIINQDEPLFLNHNWIQPINLTSEMNWHPLYCKLNKFISTQQIIEDDYYCILGDHDAYEYGFFDRIREINSEIIVVSMKRGCWDTLFASECNMKVGEIGLEQTIYRGRELKEIYYINDSCADGYLASFLFENKSEKFHFLPSAYVLFSYLQSGVWCNSQTPELDLAPIFIENGQWLQN